jgi:PAS domain S-box-containing protein
MIMDLIYAAITGSAAAAVLLRGGGDGPNRAAWLLIGTGLALWAVGDFLYIALVDPSSGPYPSLADAFYIGFYGFVLFGLHRLGRRPDAEQQLFTPTVLTVGLALATIWSWLAFSPLLENADGTTAAVITTLAYPFLDLLLLGAVVFALAANNWTPRAPLFVLLIGFTLTAAVDSIFAGQVASGSIPATGALDALWPAGAVLIAVAALMPDPALSHGPPSGGRAPGVTAGLAMFVALAVLVWDHFDRVGETPVILATLTLIAAIAQVVLLYRGNATIDRRRRDAERVYAASAQAALDCMVSADVEGRIREWNRAAELTFGYSREQAMGRLVGDLIVPPRFRTGHDNAFGQLARGSAPNFIGRRTERIAMRADGSELPIELAVTQVDTDPVLYTAFIRDITVAKKRAEEHERLAAMVRSTDDAMFSATLDGVVLAWNPAAERLYGYPTEEAIGNRLLDRMVPGQYEAQAQEMLRRVGSGESVSFESVRRRKGGEQVDVAVRYFPVRNEMGVVTGCAVVARDITDRRRREEAERRDRERTAWRRQVEDALDGDLFEFHAQPVWELDSRRISHHELLIRMRMNDEIVPPGKFLHHAERSPLMRRIDGWAIRRGIELARNSRVAINLSATSLGEAGIVLDIQDSLERCEVEPGNVIFEITETAAAENLDAARSLVGALTQLGCGVALDDFGTGYNSLAYLKHLAVTELKIDIEFIRGLAEDAADQRIVRSIVAVAENFELETVAEGVEDEPTLELLTEMGVDCAQGYLLGRPGPDWTKDLDLSVSTA